MPEHINDTENAVPSAKPSTESAWPPAPDVAPESTVPFKNIHFTTGRGFCVSDFRTGDIAIHAEGIKISGKAVRPAEMQFWIMVGACFIRLWLLAAIALEYVRIERTSTLRWEDVDRIVLDSRRSRVGVVYKEPRKRKDKHYTLATKLTAMDYEAFADAIRKSQRVTVVEDSGKLLHLAAGSPVLYTFLINLVIVAIYLVCFLGKH